MVNEISSKNAILKPPPMLSNSQINRRFFLQLILNIVIFSPFLYGVSILWNVPEGLDFLIVTGTFPYFFIMSIISVIVNGLIIFRDKQNGITFGKANLISRIMFNISVIAIALILVVLAIVFVPDLISKWITQPAGFADFRESLPDDLFGFVFYFFKIFSRHFDSFFKSVPI